MLVALLPLELIVDIDIACRVRVTEKGVTDTEECTTSYICFLPAGGAATACVGTEAKKDVGGFVGVSDRNQEIYCA